MGDVYPHETLISHIRRLLDTEFVSPSIYETVPQFARRMKRVQDYLNSSEFAAEGGEGLEGLARRLRERCQEVVKRKGERLPK